MADEAAAGGVSRRSDMETTFPVWDDAKVEEILTKEDGTPPSPRRPVMDATPSDRAHARETFFKTPALTRARRAARRGGAPRRRAFASARSEPLDRPVAAPRVPPGSRR